MKKIISLLIVGFSFQHLAFSQDQHLIDSLELQLKQHNISRLEPGKNAAARYDTTKANILYELSKSYRSNDPSKSIEYANQSLILSQQINYKKGIGNAYFTLGVSYNQKGELVQALDFFNKSLDIRSEIGDKMGMAATRNGIGLVYFSLGSYPLSLQNHFVALKIREDIKDKNGIAASYNNIGLVYMMQKPYDQALKYFFDALAINKVTGNKQYQSANLDNIAQIYTYQGNYDEAIKHSTASIKILKEIGAEFYLTDSYLIIGEAYEGLGNYSQALKSYNEALKINQELDDKEGQARTNTSIGAVYVKQSEYKLASEFLNKGLALAKEVGSLEAMKKGYEALASMDSAQGNHKPALEHYKHFVAIRDSIYNQENTNKTTALQLQYDTEKKEKQIALLTKESQLQQSELQKQNTTRNVLIAAFALTALLAAILYNRYRTKKKANAEIEKTMHHLKNTQEQLIEREKLASLGKLTVDVAKQIEIPVTHINKLNGLNRELINSIKSNMIYENKCTEELQINLQHIHGYGKDADRIVKNVLIETRRLQ